MFSWNRYLDHNYGYRLLKYIYGSDNGNLDRKTNKIPIFKQSKYRTKEEYQALATFSFTFLLSINCSFPYPYSANFYFLIPNYSDGLGRILLRLYYMSISCTWPCMIYIRSYFSLSIQQNLGCLRIVTLPYGGGIKMECSG